MVSTPTTWKTQHQANTTTTGNQDNPEVIAIGMGRYLVAWEEDEPGGPIAPGNDGDIIGQIFDALGNPIGSEFRLNQKFTDDQDDFELAARPGGGFAIVYEGGTDPGAIAIDIYDVDGKLLPGPNTVAGAEDGGLESLEVALGSDGSYLVTYRRDTDGENDEFVGSFISAAGLVGDEFTIHDDEEDSGDNAVAALSNGSYVVAYINSDVDRDVWFNIVTPGLPPAVGADKKVTTDQNPQFDVEVAALKGGGFVLVYQEPSDGNLIVRAAMYDNNGDQVKAPFTVNETFDDNQQDPAVEGLSDGGFVVTWLALDLGQVMGQRYDSAGNTVGEQFIAGSMDTEEDAAIALLEDGRFLAAFEGDGATENIFATIFDPRGDVIKGTNENDVLTSRQDGATVKGKDGKDTLLGQNKRDILEGGKGKDVLAGGKGNDKLTGGRDKDTFVFDTKLNKNKNVDKITDMKANKDTIQLDKGVFTGIGKTLTKKEFEIGRKADDKKDRIIYDDKKGKLYHDANGDKSGGKTLFATLDKKLKLDHNDFDMIA